LRETRGVQQCDRAAVTVPEQPQRLARAVDVQRVEQRRQHLVRLAVHEIDVPVLLGVARRRTAIARA
jgi:hypothetical protein